jgi:probable F420-dependent oxidoreductase
LKFGWFGVGSGILSGPEGVVAAGRAAEELGFDSVWIGEHPVLVDPRERPSPLPPHTPLLDPVAVLSFLAAGTSGIRLGTGIVILPLRNPVILAKEVASADVLSGGRVILGIGVGYVPGEYDAVGVDFSSRGSRADAYIDAMRSLWCDERPECRGPFTSLSGVQSYPRPVQPGGVPIVASGTARAALRRAVRRGNGWYGFFVDHDALSRITGELRRLAGEEERPPELGRLEITVTPPGGTVTRAEAERYEELGVDRLVLMRDFADMGGRPDPAGATAVVEAMQKVAGDLGIDPGGPTPTPAGPGIGGGGSPA